MEIREKIILYEENINEIEDAMAVVGDLFDRGILVGKEYDDVYDILEKTKEGYEEMIAGLKEDLKYV